MRTQTKRKMRVKFKDPLLATLEGEQKKVFNISESGCMLKTRSWIKVGPAKYEIEFKSLVPGTLALGGRVVRAKMVSNRFGNHYEIGMAFDLNDSRHEKFQAWFHNLHLASIAKRA